MARRLIVDTRVLIAGERERRALAAFVQPDDDLALAAVTIAELRVGVELADVAHRAARAAYVERVLETLPIVPYDAVVAEAHAVLLAHARRVGRPRGAHDLLIAATAVATGRALLSLDRRAEFADLPGVDVVPV